MQGAAFTVTEPASGETPLIVEIPHAGLGVPAEVLATLVAPARCIGRDADLFVDALYAEAPRHGATALVAHTSRYVVDLNRSEADTDGVGGVARPRGIVWRLTSEGDQALARALTPSEVQARIDTYHRPYHAALRALIERKRRTFGLAVVLAAHSMPSFARMLSGERGPPRADVVPGTQGRTTASAALIACVDAWAVQGGLGVSHDDPYKGGFTTRHYGRPQDGVHAVQVELARRLYMDEATLAPSSGFARLRSWCGGLVAELGQTALR